MQRSNSVLGYRETVAYYRHCNLRVFWWKLEMFLLVFNEITWIMCSHSWDCAAQLHYAPAVRLRCTYTHAHAWRMPIELHAHYRFQFVSLQQSMSCHWHIIILFREVLRIFFQEQAWRQVVNYIHQWRLPCTVGPNRNQYGEIPNTAVPSLQPS